MGFEGADDAFGSITTMDVWGHELVCVLPVFGDDTVVLGTGFVIKDLVFNNVDALLELDHDASVGDNAVVVVV